MRESERYRVVQEVDPRAPDDYKRHAYDVAREEAGRELYKILEQFKNPAVVEIDENIERVPYPAYWNDVAYIYPYGYREKIIITLRVTEVQHRNVEIQRVSNLDWQAPRHAPLLRRLWLALKG